MGLMDKLKKKFSKNKNKKEKIMAKFQGNKNSLDYKKIQQALNKAKGKNNNIDSIKANLNNFSKEFEKLSNNEKQEELKSEKFQKLAKDINSLEDNDLNKIMNSMEIQEELSDYENLSKQIESVSATLKNIEKENLQVQGKNIDDIGHSIDNISLVVNNSFWNKLKSSIQIPKLDLLSITQGIESIKNELKQNKNDINNSNRELAKKIDDIKFPSFPKIPNNYLKKEDFEFTINEKLKDLKEIKESSENLETVPAKVNSIEKEIKNLFEKVDNLFSSNSSHTPKHIPKEEKSVVDLAKYMTDGVVQFENIAKEYVSKISELENLDKIKKEHKKELEKIKKNEFENGKEKGKIEVIKKLAEDFPTEFKAIKSTFEDLLEEKFKKDEVLEINDENRNETIIFIDGNIDNGKYKVLSPAILIDGEILIKVRVENNIDEDEKEEI